MQDKYAHSEYAIDIGGTDSGIFSMSISGHAFACKGEVVGECSYTEGWIPKDSADHAGFCWGIAVGLFIAAFIAWVKGV